MVVQATESGFLGLWIVQGLITNEGILLDLNLWVVKDSVVQYTEENYPSIGVFYDS